MEPARFTRILVVSPHCDDAVFSCGDLLADHPGAIVVTVFAGRSPSNGKLTEWDEASGFRPGDDVMGLRREEDRAALSHLQANPVWLDFCDSQYTQSSTVEDLTNALERVCRHAEPDAVFFPLGLFHDDHKLAHAAALSIRERMTTCSWFAYEDAIYRRYRGLAQERLSCLLAAGIIVTPVPLIEQGNPAQKRQAMECYASQLRALRTPGRPGYQDVFAPESYWKVEGQAVEG
jgi:LmbE family N-acetylglucosaminyl deacetylase